MSTNKDRAARAAELKDIATAFKSVDDLATLTALAVDLRAELVEYNDRLSAIEKELDDRATVIESVLPSGGQA